VKKTLLILNKNFLLLWTYYWIYQTQNQMAGPTISKCNAKWLLSPQNIF